MLRSRIGHLMVSYFGIVILLTACLQENEVVSPSPEITGINPTAGIVGDEVIISGKNFGPTPQENEVKFNGITAEVSSSAKNTLIVTVPEGATTGKIIIVVEDQAVVSDIDFTILESPTIASFSPSKGIEGDEVTITGENFSGIIEENVVKFNGVEATVNSASTTSLSVNVPAGATSGKITVEVSELVITSKDEFTVLNSPTITSIEPMKGFEGSEVVISGTNFGETGEENVVKFNGLEATINSASGTSLSVNIPTDATSGKITIEVDELVVTSEEEFMVLRNPTITSIDPMEAVAGTEVVITGTNFGETIEENVVKFNGLEATLNSASNTSLSVNVPADATSGKITVEVGELMVESTEEFTVLNNPTITSIEPAKGVAGTEVIITGTYFSEESSEVTVEFNGTPATVTSASSQELKVVVPFEATSGKVNVSIDGRTVESEEDFEVLLPMINSFSPAIAGIGEDVTIQGENFSPVAQNNTVKIGGANAEIKSSSPTEIVITVPNGSGSDKISVTTGLNSIESTESFEYLRDIPREGLVAFYPFSANANDTGGSNLNGTVNGASLITDRFGKSDRAYAFDGVDDYIDMGNPADLQISDQITVALWTRSSSFVTSRMLVSKTDRVDGYIFDTGQLGNGDQGYTVFVYSSTATGTNFARLSNDYVADEWTFIAFTLDNSTIAFYHNEVETFRYSKARPVTDGSTGNFQIGGGDNNFFYNGDIDDVAVYNRALSEQEIVQLYNQNLSKK